MVEADDDAAEKKTTTVFPAVLYDGERETNVGNIKIHPDLVFKEFQSTLTQITGISYNNLTTYLVDSKKSKSSPDRRKILITGKVNFALIVRERNCYFFLVVKRSRRDRRRKPSKQSDLVFSLDDLSRIDWNHKDLNDARMSAYNRYYYDDRFHDLFRRRERYVCMILDSSGSGFHLPLDVNFPKIEDVYPRVQRMPNRSLCEDCKVEQKQGKRGEFHLCVYDEVVVGWFRSPAGPICRPR